MQISFDTPAKEGFNNSLTTLRIEINQSKFRISAESSLPAKICYDSQVYIGRQPMLLQKRPCPGSTNTRMRESI